VTLGKENALALDIGSHSIKMVQLEETKKGFVLKHFDVAQLAEETIVDGSIVNFAAVAEKLREVLRANKVKNRRCALSIGGSSVIVKKITLPEMTPEELEESIHWEAEQYIPFDIKEVYVDVQILASKPGQGQMDVLLVAAKKDIINDYASVCSEVGLQPVVVDVDTFCVQNMFEMNYGYPPSEIIALINIGATTTNINVVSNGVPLFTRDISTGGLTLTKALQQQLNISYEEAEHYKTGTSESLSSSSIFREVQRLSERVSEVVATEIQRSVDFFTATTISADISKVYLCGGASQNPAFGHTLERKLEIPVELINPFRNVIINPKRFDISLLQKMAPLAGCAVGLALRRQDDK
jgi:type IV pilus assembly protein PilM